MKMKKLFLMLFIFTGVQSVKAAESAQCSAQNNGVSLRIMSLNFPVFTPVIRKFASPVGGSYKVRHRVKGLAQLLAGMGDERPEVVLLQEFWSNRERKVFYNDIKHLYPHKHEDNYFSPFFLGSGLAIYSKYPLSDFHREYFKYYRGDESFANKGFLAATVHKEGLEITFATTHLQAGKKKHDKWTSPHHNLSTRQIAQLQMAQINEYFIKKYDRDIKNRYVFVAGDFNIGNDEPDYRDIFEAFDTATSMVCTESLRELQSTWGRARPGHIIDHVFSLGKDPQSGCVNVVDTIGDDISDHKALIGTLWFEQPVVQEEILLEDDFVLVSENF